MGVDEEDDALGVKGDHVDLSVSQHSYNTNLETHHLLLALDCPKLYIYVKPAGLWNKWRRLQYSI